MVRAPRLGRCTARAQGDDELVQLLERLEVPSMRPGGHGLVERGLGGIELGHDDERLAGFFLESHGGDGPTVTPFLICPHDARVRCHFEVTPEEWQRLWGSRVTEHEAVLASDMNIHLAGQYRHPYRLRHPPLLEELGLGPRLEHEARWAVDGSCDDELTLALPFDRRAVLHRGGLTLSFCVHRPSPCVLVPRQHFPARRNVRPRADGTARATPSH